MMRQIFIYIEGGGLEGEDDKGTRNARALRKGFDAFFGQLRAVAGEKRIKWHDVACGPRGQAYSDFTIGRESDPQAFHALLVDSEGFVTGPRWQHLRESGKDKWGKELCQDDENCVHLMVQAMEAWLIADRKALREFYGEAFKEEKLPDDDVETIPKEQLLIALRAATRKSDKGTYHKTQHGFDVIAILDVATVRKAAPHCEALFHVLEEQLGIATSQ
ncbi:MAG: DUF4276 family protein [Candidatus Coatesbacteria bacterium]|nr:DUF4276 family protein [Candidatus Coatesbacteria bacterium]